MNNYRNEEGEQAPKMSDTTNEKEGGPDKQGNGNNDDKKEYGGQDIGSSKDSSGEGNKDSSKDGAQSGAGIAGGNKAHGQHGNAR